MSRRFQVIVLAAIAFGVAAALRFIWLDLFPPGWHHDEALMGVMASEVYRGIQRPIFFPGYAGQEPLYLYLAAGMIALLGGNQDILPIRLTSAVVGLATLPVAYLMAKELFNRRVGLLAAALLGTSFWQVMSSRNGYRSITQPVLEGLAVYCYWRARRQRSYRWYLLAGACLAGTTYTYLGGRSFPAVLVGFGLWSLVFEGRPSRGQIKRVLALTAAAVAVAAPIYAYWLTHPGTYSARMSQVFILNPAVNQGDLWFYLSESVTKALQLFTVNGEMMWRYNLPGRPVFEWALVPAFYLGVGIVLVRAWRRDAASALLIIWMLAMLLPSVLSYDVGGYTLRAMGLVPALYLFPALGIDVAWRWLERRSLRWPRPGPLVRKALPVGVGLIVAFDAGLTYRDYFLDWSQQFGAAYEGDAHVVAEARYLAASGQPEREEVFAGSDYRGHPIISQLAPKVYYQLRWFDGRWAVVYSPQVERDSHYVLSFTTFPPGDLDRYFPPETLTGVELFDRGIEPNAPPPKYKAFRLTPAQVRAQVERWLSDPATTKTRASFGGELEVLGAQVPAEVKAGEMLPVTVIWRVLRTPSSDDYMFFAHLIDEQAVMYAQADRSGYPTPEWRSGDVVVARHDLAIPDGLEPGKYLVDFGVYDRRDVKRLAMQGTSVEQTTAVIAAVKVQPEQAPAMAKNAVGKRVGQDFRLLGYDLDLAKGADGRQAVNVRLLWSALGKPADDYTVFVQMLSPDGKLVAQSDAMPAANRFPTSIWDAGDVVADAHRIALAPGLAPGNYRLIAGMYLLRTGQRLPIEGGGDFVSLGSIALGQ